jgi:hypothetical protein
MAAAARLPRPLPPSCRPLVLAAARRGRDRLLGAWAGSLLELALLLMLLFWMVGAWGRLSRLRTGVAQAWGQLDDVLMRRSAALDMLIAAVRDILQHEAGSLQALEQAQARQREAALAVRIRPHAAEAVQAWAAAEREMARRWPGCRPCWNSIRSWRTARTPCAPAAAGGLQRPGGLRPPGLQPGGAGLQRRADRVPDPAAGAAVPPAAGRHDAGAARSPALAHDGGGGHHLVEQGGHGGAGQAVGVQRGGLEYFSTRAGLSRDRLTWPMDQPAKRRSSTSA